MKRIFFLLLSLYIFILTPVFSSETYPLIKSLDNSDIFFKQITVDINTFYKSMENNSDLPPLLIYRYKPDKNDTLFTIAALINLPYETIATLNRMETPLDIRKRKEILVSNMPGIFINKTPVTDLEYIVASWRQKSNKAKNVTVFEGADIINFIFIPGAAFHNVERSFFLGIMFRFPLPKKSRITSFFGPRLQPFTGKPEFHEGLDIAAPIGTSVLAAREGIVEKTGKDRICGNFILLRHESGYETRYCHLKKIFVSLHQKVRSGTIIGEVGVTGMSTGPHLHFEIRKRGKPTDPLPMIGGKHK